MTSPKKQRKIINLILAIILAVGVWLYVINVENPTSPTTVRDIPITIVGVIGALLMGAGLFALVLQAYGL